MPKLILRCNYLKNSPPAHLANYINYIGTRDGVEKVSSTTALLPATAKQKELIADILTKVPDAKRMHEYHDYVQRPTRENASEFITQALENNLDIIAKKKNYMDYLANRPGVEIIGTHGLFSNEGDPIVLSHVAEEVANHTGVIWTNVISLRREDAERLGYDSAAQWQALLRSRVQLLCENYKIDSRNLKWYAAFHNESHHPHVHMVVYSKNPSEGYLTTKGINAMRSVYAHDIFRQDFISIYEKTTKQRDRLKEQAEKSLLFLLQQMQKGICHNPRIAEQMQLLSKRLQNTGGKKVYGYLKADVKAIVNIIVDELAKEECVAECYREWQKCRDEIQHYYKDAGIERIPLSQQKELKSIKNMVIREAVRFGEGYLYLEEADTEDEVTYYAKWTNRYKEARGYLYGTAESEADEEAAYEIMLEEAEAGNAYAMHDMGKIYAQGIGTQASREQAEEWYGKSLNTLLLLEETQERVYQEYRIGKMYQYGLGTEENPEEAVRWFHKAAEKGHIYACYSLAMLYLRGQGVERDDERAYGLFLRSYDGGNPYAAYELGKLCEAGRGTVRNPEKAQNYYRAAFLGFINMEKKAKDDTLWYRIGCMYLHGIGTEPDEEQAERYLQKAYKYGNTHAAYQLARLYIRQETQKLREDPEATPDYEKIIKAVKWLEEAAGQENPFADYALGRLYKEGVLLEKDMEKAVFHLQRAANAGNSFAQYQLGKIYLEEEYKNIPAAVQYLTLAADQKNKLAAYRLGRLYLMGEDLPKNIERALGYLDMSAEAGNQYAQYLGKLYLIGKEVEQDREKAYEYFSCSAEQGNIYAAYFLEHWNDMPHPDLLLMATRLMHHLGNVIEENMDGSKKGGNRQRIDRKLARKIRQKKMAQGHAEDDREQQMM